MSRAQYDVAIVGAGCAGLTAAIGLARAGFAVVVVEASKVGVSGSLGGVFFAENLVEADIVGRKEFETLHWERRIVERGGFITDGRQITGYLYRDADAFPDCYTIVRSRFDSSLAALACRYGVDLRTETTVESLIRTGRRIIGVATTRGPLYAKLTFLAEGDAGYLVGREGLDRSREPRDNPSFLYALQQIVELPPGSVEERFRVGVEKGVAYDLLLRNPGQMRLNARGMLCSTRQGMTLSVILPVEKLHGGFDGKPRQLLDWFLDMPALRPWLRDGKPGAWTATLLRTGGLRDIPYLVEDGLVVGGAAAGLGLDFPSLNLTGPATATGLLLSRAAARIRSEGGDFDRESLTQHYLEPLQQTRYWRDVEFLHRWPNYVRKTRVLFDAGLDLLLDSSSIWGRSRRWLPWKLFAWLRLLSRISWGRWDELRQDFLHLSRTLRLREVTPRPALTRLLLDGALNAFRDLARQPRPHLPPGGALRLYFHSAEAEGRASAVPHIFRRWFERFRPVLASAGRTLHDNDDTSLSAKMTRTIALLVRQINLFDLIAVAALAFPVVLMSTALAVGSYVFRRLGWGYVSANRLRPLTDEAPGVHSGAEVDPKGTLHPVAYAAGSPSIHILWRSTQPLQQAASIRDLPHICPAGVFEIRGMPPETVRVVVRAERCIYCETCWRTNSLVDWGRNGTPSPRPSPATTEARQNELVSLFDRMEQKLCEFETALSEGQGVVDRPHNDYLETLARFTHQLTLTIRESIQSRHKRSESAEMFEITDALVALTDERTRRTWEGRFAWAVADGRLLRQHHLAELRRLLALPTRIETAPKQDAKLSADWMLLAPVPHAEDACGMHLLADIAARRYLLGTLETNAPPTMGTNRDELLAALAVEVREGLAARIGGINKPASGKRQPPDSEEKNRGADALRSPKKLSEAYRRRGRQLFVDLDETRKLFDVPGEWPTLEQRRVLRAERAELLEAERRLLALANDGCEWADDEDIVADFGRQTAHILGGKLLLLQTFARLEAGADAELAILLLRVWLDYAATLLDEYTIVVRDRLRPIVHHCERPLVEPDSGAPLRTQAEYLATPPTYNSGDFLLAPLDLLQPRLVPEMVETEEIAAERNATARATDSPEKLYLTEALTVESMGRRTHAPFRPLDLEEACSRLILTLLRRENDDLRERCVILQKLADEVVPRWLQGMDARTRNLERDVLELESLKADFRQRLTAAWQVFGDALGRNADVQASCFALAEAAAWLKAADSTLGRVAWINRLCQAEDREEPPVQQTLARRVLAHCFAEVRDRLFRFDEDLASLRRGYFAPHVHAVKLLLRRSSHRLD